MNARTAPIVDVLPRCVMVLFALACACALWRIVASIGLEVPFDPNEGWNAYHAAAAMGAGALYPDAHGYFFNNYPPLSFYVVGMFGRLIGDQIIAGRIVSLASFGFVAFALALAARRMRCNVIAASIAALLFASCLLFGSDYVGMDDPQPLGHALDLLGLLLLLRSPRHALSGAALFAAAIFVKHNLVAMPAAVAAWLCFRDRRAALRFASALAGLVLLGLALFQLVYGASLLAELASPRTYSFATLASSLKQWLAWSAVPLCLFAAVAISNRRDEAVAFCAWYAALAILVAVIFAGGAGVDANIFFDADIALALGSGLALDRLAKHDATRSALTSAALLVPLASLLYFAYDEDWREPDYWLHPLAEESAMSRGDIAFLRAHPGSALCETLAYCYWAQKAPAVDVFNLGQALATGARRDDGLARLFETQHFAAIQFDSLAPFALTPHLRAVLQRDYAVDHSNDDGVFLVPRTRPVRR